MNWAIAAHISPKNGRIHNSKFPSAGNVHGNKNYAFPQCKSCLHIAAFHQPSFVLFYTSRVIFKGHVTMEEIVFTLKHHWMTVDYEPFELYAIA